MFEAIHVFDDLQVQVVIVDKWEKEIAQGLVPDIMEGLPQEEAEELLNWSKSAYRKKMSGEYTFIGDNAEKSERFNEVEREEF